jgi:hypothetical protein
MIVVKRGGSEDVKSLEAYRRKLERELKRVTKRLKDLADKGGR